MSKTQHSFSSIEPLLVSKERVANFGEVYTGAREINAILDLIKQETERIDSRFLEPACGTGNFLVATLKTQAFNKVPSDDSSSNCRLIR